MKNASRLICLVLVLALLAPVLTSCSNITRDHGIKITNGGEITLKVGESYTLTSNALAEAVSQLNWYCVGDSVSVDENGVVTALSVGTAIVRVEYGESSDSALFYVVADDSSTGGDNSGESGDNSGESGDNSGESGDNSGESGEIDTADTHYDDIFWDTTPIIFSMTLCSNNTELPSSCPRYLAGNLDYLLSGEIAVDIDDMISERNAMAEQITKVDVRYDYIPDDHEMYGWGKNVDTMVHNKSYPVDGETPDIYCNFVYDMVAASLKGAFANLLSSKMDTDGRIGVNYFRFTDSEFVDNGEGYMLEYMRSLTMSKNKMYCLSSDYFTDAVRAFLVVPVSVALMNSLVVNLDDSDAYNSDRDGDGDFDIDDFYQLVWDGEWSYQTLIDMSEGGVFIESAKPVSPGIDNTNGDLSDRLIFAISSDTPLSAAGMLYSSDVSIITKELTEKIDDDNNRYDDYTYSYPDPYADEASDLYELSDALADLFTNHVGIVSVSNYDTLGYAKDGFSAIRARFASNQILFGGCVCLGSLEYGEYKQMNIGGAYGFGIVPVPLYRTADGDGNKLQYQTQIHNVGRIGAIRYSTTKFAQCSAFLDYQSTYSTDILNEYFGTRLPEVGNNSKMLSFIRENVRSGFDKAFEDAIGRRYATDNDVDGEGIGTTSEKRKWHSLIMADGYKLTKSEMMLMYETYVAFKEEYLTKLERDFENLPE